MADIEKNTEDVPMKGEVKKTADLDIDDEDFMEATWEEVFRGCCCHSADEWAWIFAGVCAAAFFLYFFLFGLDLLGTGAKVMGGCTAGALFGDETNPVAGVMIGILATVLLQSSSTTTSIIVSLVGAGSVNVRQGIFMVMGANIGTSVTNTIVALGHLGDGDQLERAFAGATVHDMFNFMTVAIFLPVEAATQLLNALTAACVRNVSTGSGEKWVGPIKRIVGPLSSRIIKSNKKLINKVADGASCSDFYPTECEDAANPTKGTCSKRGLIDCNSDACPAFFTVGATQRDDQLSGFVTFLIGLAILFVCLFGLVKVLQKMLLGMSKQIIYKATNINGYLAILVGTGITILVQSSSITTSTFTPLVGMGVIRLEQMYPITLGANIGTTVTSILASLVQEGTNSLQVALSHLFFNIFGIAIWYPVPLLRNIPLHAARQLGKTTRVWRGFPVIYIIVMFLLVPLFFFGISLLFTQNSVAFTTLGSILVVVVFALLVWAVYWWRYLEGQTKCYDCMVSRQRKAEAIKTLPEDMEFLKAKITALSERAGLPLDAKDMEDSPDTSEENVEEDA